MMLWLMDPTMGASMENMLISKHEENAYSVTPIVGKLTLRAFKQNKIM